jgi:hypothetical protein
MRGKSLHNLIAERVRAELEGLGEVHPEHKLSGNGTTTYVDLFFRRGLFVLAIEVETTIRHAIKNAGKAALVGVPLWIVVPHRRLKSAIANKTNNLGLRPSGQPIKILLLGTLRQTLTNYLSRRIDGGIKNKQMPPRQRTLSVRSKNNHAS